MMRCFTKPSIGTRSLTLPSLSAYNRRIPEKVVSAQARLTRFRFVPENYQDKHKKG
jgi:hypothetical protein